MIEVLAINLYSLPPSGFELFIQTYGHLIQWGMSLFGFFYGHYVVGRIYRMSFFRAELTGLILAIGGSVVAWFVGAGSWSYPITLAGCGIVVICGFQLYYDWGQRRQARMDSSQDSSHDSSQK